MTAGNGDTGHYTPLDEVRRHVAHSRQYLDNAFIALQDGEAGKAGELLWGSVAQAFHALAAFRQRNVATHRSLKNFVIWIGDSTRDSSLRDDFEATEKYHDNFYDVTHTTEDVEDIIPTVNRLIDRAFRLLPPEFLEDSRSRD